MPSVPLSPIDHLFIGTGSYPIEFAFFYPNGLSRRSLEDKMFRGWQRLAKSCPVLTAKLAFCDERFVLEEGTMSDPPWEWQQSASSAHPHRVHHRYQLVNPVTSTQNQPLVKIKITEGSDGATLGFSVSHAIADGFTYFSLLTAWASASRGEQIPTFDHRRDLVGELAQGQADTGVIGFSKTEKRTDIARENIGYKHKIFSREELNELLTKEDNGQVRMSHNDVACALLWREHLTHFSPSENEFSLVNPVDFRRIMPNFPTNYVGNAVVLSRTDLTRRQLLDQSVGDTARLIRSNLARVQTDYIQKTIANLASLLRKDARNGCNQIHIAHPRHGLLITNLSRLPLQGLDFGEGIPTTCLPLTPCTNTVVFTSDGSGGMEAHIQYSRV